jgi:hypothetical protein
MYNALIMLKTRNEVRDWLADHGVRGWEFRQGSLVVDLPNGRHVHLNDPLPGEQGVRPIAELPVQFGIVSGDFTCNSHMTSFKGTPMYVGGKFNCEYTSIKSFEHFPMYIHRGFDCYGIPGQSISGIDKLVKYIKGAVTFETGLTHVLGLLLIPGITDFASGNDVGEILRRHLHTKDIIAAQDELIDAGFIAQARL